MIQNNNLSILPWYEMTEGNPTPQDCQKWWAYGDVWPLVTNGIPPFQTRALLSSLTLCPADPNVGQEESISLNLNTKEIDGYIYTVFRGMTVSAKTGRYYLRSGANRVSDIFTIVHDLSPYLKIEWWDNEDFIMDAGAIVYNDSDVEEPSNIYKNVLYLPADLAKPEYTFEEEGENRDGYFFPTKQLSGKKYRFSFLAPEYICDVMRLIRMSDNIVITYRGVEYYPDTFLMTPAWIGNGNLANVECEFTTDTIAKRIGRFSPSLVHRGDYNDSYNNDYTNQVQ